MDGTILIPEPRSGGIRQIHTIVIQINGDDTYRRSAAQLLRGRPTPD